MDWISELSNKRSKLAKDAAKLDQGIQGVWTDLCAALSDSVNYYKAIHSGKEYQTNGEPYSTWTLRQGEQLVLTVRPERRVAVDGLNPALDITFGLDAQDTVWLVREGKKLGVKEAAKAILGPVLFPDLQNPARLRI